MLGGREVLLLPKILHSQFEVPCCVTSYPEVIPGPKSRSRKRGFGERRSRLISSNLVSG